MGDISGHPIGVMDALARRHSYALGNFEIDRARLILDSDEPVWKPGHLFVVDFQKGAYRVHVGPVEEHDELVDNLSLDSEVLLGGGNLYLGPNENDILRLDGAAPKYGSIPPDIAEIFIYRALLPEFKRRRIEVAESFGWTDPRQINPLWRSWKRAYDSLLGADEDKEVA